MWGEGESTAGQAARAARAAADDLLLARVAAGDHAAWSMLVSRHLPRLVAFSWRILGNWSEAEDVAQECFARLVHKAPAWRPGGASLSTWLHRVATNLCIDQRRRPASQTLALDDFDADALATGGAAETDGALDTVRTVRRALARLPERQRAAIVLVHYQGFGNIEAAATLAVSVEAVESLLARARRALRAEIAANAPDLMGDIR